MERGTLRRIEPHPAIFSAWRYYAALSMKNLSLLQEAFASCAIENNRLAEICTETLRRLLTGQPVSDRYFLGLVWTVREIIEGEAKCPME